MEATVQTDNPSMADHNASAAKVLVLEQAATASGLPPGPCVRVVLQQCLSAQLMVQSPSVDEPPRFVEIQRGVIVFVCFLRGATKTHVEKMAKMVLSVKLSESDSGKLVSVADLPGDILVVPQATLGGTVKGKLMQYHKNIAKEEGLPLYAEFVSIFRKTIERSEKCLTAGTVVRHGTYGNRQVFSCQTNGPYTHLMEV